ncbi:MAG TPA: hypothetical protein DD418_00430 [Pseudomonas sp.]|nr:hypothetical protein [Pseudomonas sp.]
MYRLAVLAFAALWLSPWCAAAQSPATGYALCTLTDIGHTPVRIWASPVLEFDAPTYDVEALNRLAGAFHRHVAGLGGAGDKNCVATNTRSEAETLRQEQRALWDKRAFFVKVGNWHDVPWTPPADVLAARNPGQAQARYFRCYATMTDVPGRVDRAWTVSSGVFEKPVPGDRALAAALEQAHSYGEEFRAVAQAAGIPAELSSCSPYDTRAEADKAEQDYRRLIGGFNTKYSLVAWVPGDHAMPSPATPPPAAQTVDAAVRPMVGLRIGTVGAELAQASGLGAPRGAWVIEVADGSPARQGGVEAMDIVLEIAGQAVAAPGDVTAIIGRLRPGFEAPVQVWRAGVVRELKLIVPAPQAATPVKPDMAASPTPGTVRGHVAPANPAALYCLGSVQRSKPPLLLRTPIRQQATGDANPTVLRETLASLYAAARQAYPGEWHDQEVKCQATSNMFPGETMCIAFSSKHFGGTQSAVLFCNATREQIEARSRDMDKVDGGTAQAFDWPSS